MAMQQIAGDNSHYANPYGMMGQGGPGMNQNQMGQGQMQRRSVTDGDEPCSEA